MSEAVYEYQIEKFSDSVSLLKIFLFAQLFVIPLIVLIFSIQAGIVNLWVVLLAGIGIGLLLALCIYTLAVPKRKNTITAPVTVQITESEMIIQTKKQLRKLTWDNVKQVKVLYENEKPTYIHIKDTQSLYSIDLFDSSNRLKEVLTHIQAHLPASIPIKKSDSKRVIKIATGLVGLYFLFMFVIWNL